MADREMPDEWRALWLAYCEEKERGEELAAAA